MERSESRPLRALDSTGTPRTGRTVFDAVMPGRCAAPPAPAMITSIPRFSAAEAYSNRRLGVRWAETTRVSCGTPRPARVLEVYFMVSQSEPEPMMMPTRGCSSAPACPSPRMDSLGFFRTITVHQAREIMPVRKPALQRPSRTGGDILRFFLARGDLRALLPIVAELADQIERTGDENGVFRRGLGERAFEGALGVRDYGKTRGMMAGNFRKLRGGNGARNARRGEDDFCGMREKKTGYFVDGFIAKGGVDQPDFAAREVLFEEMGEFACGAGIVRTIEVNGRVGLQFF